MKSFKKILIFRRIHRTGLVFYLSFFLIIPFCVAQKEDSTSSSSLSSTKYYLSLGADNELLMKVNVWGEVKKPGILDVPDNTDLVSLLSFANDPIEVANHKKIGI